MARSDTTALSVALREPSGSRATRRLRREGKVPGIIYGGGEDPINRPATYETVRLHALQGTPSAAVTRR